VIRKELLALDLFELVFLTLICALGLGLADAYFADPFWPSAGLVVFLAAAYVSLLWFTRYGFRKAALRAREERRVKEMGEKTPENPLDGFEVQVMAAIAPDASSPPERFEETLLGPKPAPVELESYPQLSEEQVAEYGEGPWVVRDEAGNVVARCQTQQDTMAVILSETFRRGMMTARYEVDDQ
jgi:hypothetical protein